MPLRPRKRLGQHFLHDPAVIGKLVAAIAPDADDCMVEIGGGRGALTFPLLETVRTLHVVEIDRRLADDLASTADPRRLTLHRGDALAFDFSGLAARPGCLRVVGNLPYNVSTPLLFHLLRHRSAIRDMHLMLQREVAERLAAGPGGRDYGRLTVMLAPWMEVRTCFHIGPGAFSPPPKVRSTLVRLIPRRPPLFAMENPERFSALVARAFSMRRKTLARSLRGWLTREQIAGAGIDPGTRPQRLRAEDFERLARLLRRTPAADAGPPAADAGPPTVDAGPPAADAGPPTADAGPPAADAGPPAADAGLPTTTDTGALSLRTDRHPDRGP